MLIQSDYEAYKSYLIMDKKKHFDLKKVKFRVNHTDFKVIIDTGWHKNLGTFVDNPPPHPKQFLN